MKDKLNRFMQGRYGVDNFARFTLGVALFVIVVGSFMRQNAAGKIAKISPTAFHYYYCLLLFTTCAGDFPDSVNSLRRIHLGRPP